MTLARPYPERIEELERIVDQLTSESAKYQRELVQLRSVNIAVRKAKTELERENDELRQANAEMVSTIQARDAEIERLKATETALAEAHEVVAGALAVLRWAQTNGSLDMNSLDRANLYGWQARTGVWLSAHGIKGTERTTTQSDLPPTRAEEEKENR